MSEVRAIHQRLALRFRPPPDRPFVSLSHAISWMAFRRSTAGPALSRLLGITGEPPCHDRALENGLLDQAIKSAVERLTDLGLGGKIKILGKKYTNVLADDHDDEICTEQIPAEKLADYRGFDTLDDTLFLTSYREVKMAWGKNRREIHSPLERHYRFVLINRDDLMREFPHQVDNPRMPLPFTDAERKEWIRDQPQQSADIAYKKYKVHRRYDGTKQRGFREEWKTERGTRLGRPTKS